MSDEAHFHLCGYVNKQNYRFWGTENPCILHEEPFHPLKVTVWCGVYRGKMIEDDDDTHICLKCHLTISGLDAYVAHRKSGCGASTSKPRTLSPLIPPDEQDFALKADDFFSLLELQSSSKKTPTSSGIAGTSAGTSGKGVLTRSKIANITRASDWIGGHQLREFDTEDPQTNLIKAVDNISGHIKKDEHPLPYHDESSSSSSSSSFEEDFIDHHAPPRTHTGGKWKPSSPIQWLRPPSTHEVDWWKPLEEEEDKNAPPPDHTKGKWIPGLKNLSVEETPLRKSSGMVQYWCGPCNRRLASKIVYERHLKSELHYKRTIHEREFETPHDYLNQKTVKRDPGKRKIKKPEILWTEKKKETKKRIKKHTYIRCEVCKSKVLNYLMGKHLISHYHCRRRSNFKHISHQMVLDHILGVVLQSPFQCSACRFYCNGENQFLHHWRSEDHTLVAESSPGWFLCIFCKYETKYNDIMQQHLLSESHKEVVSVINRSVPIIIKKIVPTRCETCKKCFRYNAELRKHCFRENHQLCTTSTDKYQGKYYCPHCDFILKSYKALQKHILRMHDKNFYFCSTCELTFDTEMESKMHRKTPEHKYAVLEKNNVGDNSRDLSKTCSYCYESFSNVLSWKQHLQKEHPEHFYSCLQCGQKFTLSQEVTQHIKSKSCSFPSTSSLSSSCLFQCDKCAYKTNSQADSLFHTALHTDPIPVMLPSGKGKKKFEEDGKRKKIEMYKCPVCEKIFRRSSLRCHVRQHSNERPFKCDKCNSGYTRKSNLVDHMKTKHSEDYNKRFEDIEDDPDDPLPNVQQRLPDTRQNQDKNEEDTALRKKKFLCAECGKSFLKQFTLQQHYCTHLGKDYSCHHPGCVYQARSEAELRNHALIHTDIKPFQCPHCDHRTRTKSQLKRHMKVHEGDASKKYMCPFCPFSARVRSHLKRHQRLHTGAKPYKCPHCSHTCNNLENLRKHILLTNKHPGKYIYTCTWCPSPENQFASNFAKDFHAHLVHEHSDRFDAASAKTAASRLLGLYDATEDESGKEIDSFRPPPSPAISPGLLPGSSHRMLEAAELLGMAREDNELPPDTWAIDAFLVPAHMGLEDFHHDD